MHNKNISSKIPSNKHQPKGIKILYEDNDILVVDKIHGLLTIGTEHEKENTAYFLLNDYVKKGNARSRNRVFIVHRLDRETSGVLVFAKNDKAKRILQDNWHNCSKTYFAVVLGMLPEKEGVVSSYLAENNVYRVYSVQNANQGKYAKTGYKVIKETAEFSLLEINLFTGRKNQIRVHLADLGHPVVGDKIYGTPNNKAQRLALHSANLTITHPATNKEMTFKTDIPTYFKSLVKI